MTNFLREENSRSSYDLWQTPRGTVPSLRLRSFAENVSGINLIETENKQSREADSQHQRRISMKDGKRKLRFDRVIIDVFAEHTEIRRKEGHPWKILSWFSTNFPNDLWPRILHASRFRIFRTDVWNFRISRRKITRLGDECSFDHLSISINFRRSSCKKFQISQWTYQLERNRAFENERATEHCSFW